MRCDWFDYRAPEYSDIDPMRIIAILPTAVVEQHGPHLPTGTDTIIGEGAAVAPQDHRARRDGPALPAGAGRGPDPTRMSWRPARSL